MTKEEQLDFAMDITNNLQEAILTRVKHCPDNWDGIELRRWIGDYYSMHFKNVGTLEGMRKRYYKNEITVNTKLT